VSEPVQDWGTLCDYDTGKAIRPATREEWLRTAHRVHEAACGGTGSYSGEWAAFETGGLPDSVQVAYVDGGPDIEIDTASGEPVLVLPPGTEGEPAGEPSLVFECCEELPYPEPGQEIRCGGCGTVFVTALPPGWREWTSPAGVTHAIPPAGPCATCGQGRHDNDQEA
jgi:hypothetical protein